MKQASTAVDVLIPSCFLLLSALVLSCVVIAASRATRSNIRQDEDSNLVLDAEDRLVRLLGADVLFGNQNESLSALSDLVTSIQTQMSMQASRMMDLERNLTNMRENLNVTAFSIGSMSSPATSAAQLYAAGAISGQNYYLSIKGVTTLVTLRVLNGIPFGVSSTPITYSQIIRSWLYSGNGYYRGNITAAPTTYESDPALSVYNYNTSGWTSVTIDVDYVPGCTSCGWYIRSPPFYITGSFKYSGAVDDNEAWSLIPYPNTGNSLVVATDASADGGITQRCGCNDHSWTGRLVTCNPGVYIWAGRGLQGSGASFLIVDDVISVNSSRFFSVLSM